MKRIKRTKLCYCLPGRIFMSHLLAVAVLATIVISGCQSTAAPVIVPNRELRWANPATTVLAVSVEQRAIDYTVLGTGPDVVLLMATIHGNENAGTDILRTLTTYLQGNRHILEGRTVVIVPLTNPDGLALNTRTNANGVDLNRNFPADNRLDNDRNGPSGLSEPESRAIYDLIERYKPDRIITFHEPLNCIDYDGPGLDLARHIAQYCPLRVRKLNVRPGSLGAYAGETLGIPIITVELPRADGRASRERLWEKYGEMTVSAVTYSGGINTNAK